MQLLNSAGNGNGNTVLIERLFDRSKDQFFTCFVSGTFDGGTVTLEISPNGGTTWFQTGVSLTAAGAQNVEFRANAVRGVVSGGGASVSINMLLI